MLFRIFELNPLAAEKVSALFENEEGDRIRHRMTLMIPHWANSLS
jgi:hypothetical protein